MIHKSNSGRTGDKKMQKRKNRWYIAVAAVVILAVVLVLAVVPGKKGKNKKDPKMIEPTQQEQASEIPTETEEVFDYSATETAETKSLPKSVVSKQGILIDVDAGTILAGKDALKRMVPASMTKIFTVLVAAENIKPEQLDELVTISIDATDFSYSNDCSNTGYEVDEQVTVRDLFYGTILPSGADSAVSLATYVAGSQDAFVDMMNQELEKMGLSETTHFTNCVGIYNDDHYSTPREDGERHKHPDILERRGDDQKEPSDHHAFSTEPVRVIPVIGIIQRPRNAEANGVIRLYRRQEVA